MDNFPVERSTRSVITLSFVVSESTRRGLNVTISFTMNQETSTGTIPRTTKRDIFLKESLVSAIKGRKK